MCRGWLEARWRSRRDHKVKIGEHELNAETLMLGYGYDPSLSEGSVKPPVFLTSTFVFQTAEQPHRVSCLARPITLGPQFCNQITRARPGIEVPSTCGLIL